MQLSLTRRYPRHSRLLRLMFDLRRFTLGVIVTVSGLYVELRRGRRRWALALGNV